VSQRDSCFRPVGADRVELTPKPDSFGRLNKKPIERVRLKSGSIDQESEDRPRFNKMNKSQTIDQESGN